MKIYSDCKFYSPGRCFGNFCNANLKKDVFFSILSEKKLRLIERGVICLNVSFSAPMKTVYGPFFISELFVFYFCCLSENDEPLFSRLEIDPCDLYKSGLFTDDDFFKAISFCGLDFNSQYVWYRIFDTFLPIWFKKYPSLKLGDAVKY